MSSSSASGSSLRLFFAIEPECFSSTRDSRHFARDAPQPTGFGVETGGGRATAMK
jgi:hypothetical protein